MADSPSRVILDTNLFISYLISRKLIKIDLLLKKEAIRLIFSEESLGEFIAVASRPKFKKFFSEEDIHELLSLIDHFAELVEVQSAVNLCRDPKDNFLLVLAKDSNADYLVTGDKDLLEIENFEGTQIITFADLEKAIK